MENLQFSVGIEEFSTACRERFGELEQELLMQKLLNKKTQEKLQKAMGELEEYKAAEAARAMTAAASRTAGEIP